MVTDIVFPNGNENEFLSMAEKLGYDEMIFCYENDGKINIVEEKIKKINGKVKIGFCLKADKKNIQKMASGKNLVLFESDRENDRWVIEKNNPSIIFGFEDEKAKDFIHHRNSGLNQVLCKMMSAKGIKYGLPLSSLLESKDNYRAQIIGRVKQNIKLCRKYKIKMKSFSFAKDPYQMRSPKDVASLLCLLGMQQKEAKDSLD